MCARTTTSTGRRDIWIYTHADRFVSTMTDVFRNIIPLVIACAMIGVGVAGLAGWITAKPSLLVGGVVAVILLSVSAYQSYRAMAAS